MRLADWIHPPRHVLAVFAAVAIVSAGALAWLGSLLLAQDKDVELLRRRERLERAADRASASMQRALAEIELLLGSHAPNPPSGVLILRETSSGIAARPEGSLLYYPEPPHSLEASRDVFSGAEQVEFAQMNPAAAAESYLRLTADPDVAIRAGALARLARVRRKLHDSAGALRAYEQLFSVPNVTVERIPTGLFARAGRASVFDETHRADELRQEAAALEEELQQGHWPITKSEYEFYSAQASAWLGTNLAADSLADPDLAARAAAVEWLWENRHLSDGRLTRRLVPVAGTQVLLIWSESDELTAAVAGPGYLNALSREALPDQDLSVILGDSEGRALGTQAVPVRPVAERTAAAANLPWSLSVFSTQATPLESSPRRNLLLAVLAVLGLVWLTSGYFIVRAISRELSVARLKSDFVAAVSHEFRSPLSSLCQISEMLASDRLPSEQRHQSYEILSRETHRLRRLVEGLLDFGRFESGAGAYRFESIEIGGFLELLIADFQERVADPAGYRIEAGALRGETYVRADQEALTRAIWNLLDNAVKYSPECHRVWVNIGREGDRVSIAVRDQGLGVPPREQREIFENFVRGADSRALRIKGTGIGLAMVRHIIRAHGGEILLSSQPGKGSQFTVLLHTIGGPA
jgi:signal transduction histidine kinase